MTEQEDDNGVGGDDIEDIAHHPHDGLVKRIFTDPETAAVELRQVLPATLCDRLDWGTLRVEPSSFIDPKLKPRHSDILYTVTIAGSERRISLYTVLEHQSKPDARMAARSSFTWVASTSGTFGSARTPARSRWSSRSCCIRAPLAGPSSGGCRSRSTFLLSCSRSSRLPSSWSSPSMTSKSR